MEDGSRNQRETRLCGVLGSLLALSFGHVTTFVHGPLFVRLK